MNKTLIISIFAALLSAGSAQAQKYFVSSVTPAGTAYFQCDLANNTATLGSSAGELEVAASYNQPCTALSDQPWCTATIADNTLTISAEENTGNPRTALITISSKDLRNRQITVNQLGNGSAIALSPASIDIDKDACQFSVQIAAGSAIKSVSIAESCDWITPDFTTADLKSSNTLTLSFKAAAMTQGSERTTAITVTAEGGSAATISVRQSFQGALAFAVISDTHVENNKGVGAGIKVPQALKNLTSHKPLDAIFVAGDLTDGGSADQYKKFVTIWGNDANFTNPVGEFVFMMGNHDNFNASGADNYKNGLKDFNLGEPYPFDQYRIIKGYPFISLSQRNSANHDIGNTANGTAAYPKATCDSLTAWMARAAKECPGKPIFVITHVAPRHTCYSSWPNLEGDGGSWPAWSMNVLNPILNKYPQAVVFAGHSHYPLGDPRSIHQGTNPKSERQNFYTVINTASTTYSEIHAPAVDEGNHPAGYENITEGMIITEQPNGDIEIRRYDTFRNEEIDASHRWVLKAPFDGTMFEYADIRDTDDNPDHKTLRNGLPAPVFAPETAARVEADAFSATVTFPQATDDNCVFRYRVRTLKDGMQIKENFVFSQFYLNSQAPDSLSVKIAGLAPETAYSFEITAYDSYDNTSEPIVIAFSTTEDNDPANQVPARSGLWTFDNANNLLANTEGTAELKAGTFSPTVSLKDNAAAANITSVPGPTSDNLAAAVPAYSLLKLIHGAGKSVGTYTLQMDIKMKAVNKYASLLQISPANDDDCDICVNSNAQIGISALGYGGKIYANTWHRVLFVNRGSHLYLYLDGKLINDAASTRWNLAADGTLLFADDDGEVLDLEVAEIAYWDKALTDNQIYKLGLIKANNYLNLKSSSAALNDKELEFSVNINGNVAPTFELPDWIEAVDVAPVIGAKDYKFKALPMDTIGTRTGHIIIKGDGIDNQTFTISQTLNGDEEPAAIGTWTFDNADNLTLGEGAASLTPATKVTGGIQQKGSAAEAGFSAAQGPTEQNGAIHVKPKAYFCLNHAQPSTVSTYTLMMDIKLADVNGYKALLQTNLKDSNDGDLFIKDNGIGLNVAGLGYHGNLKTNTWHRIVFVLKDNYATIYIDGKKVSASTAASSYWELDNGYALLFADNDGEEGEMDVAEIRFWNIALTAEQAESLGTVAP